MKTIYLSTKDILIQIIPVYLKFKEFNALDFNFPWAKFPPRRDMGPLPIASQKNLFFG